MLSYQNGNFSFTPPPHWTRKDLVARVNISIRRKWQIKRTGEFICLNEDKTKINLYADI